MRSFSEGQYEEGARKRVDRAVEKLRRFFAQRGVAIPVTAFSAALAAKCVQASPVLLVSGVNLANAAYALSPLAVQTLQWLRWRAWKPFVALLTVLTIGTALTVYWLRGIFGCRSQNCQGCFRRPSYGLTPATGYENHLRKRYNLTALCAGIMATF